MVAAVGSPYVRLLERALQVNYKDQELREEKSRIESGTKTTAKQKQPRQMQGSNKTAVTQISWPYPYSILDLKTYTYTTNVRT